MSWKNSSKPYSFRRSWTGRKSRNFWASNDRIPKQTENPNQERFWFTLERGFAPRKRKEPRTQ